MAPWQRAVRPRAAYALSDRWSEMAWDELRNGAPGTLYRQLSRNAAGFVEVRRGVLALAWMADAGSPLRPHDRLVILVTIWLPFERTTDSTPSSQRSPIPRDEPSSHALRGPTCPSANWRSLSR